MSKQNRFVVPPYTALAPIYNEAGFAQAVEEALPRYILHAQSIDWAGRRVLDLGCGTGVSSWWLAQNGYYTAGVDNSPAMLEQARAYGAQFEEMTFEPPDFVTMDIRQLESPIGMVDMVLAVGGVINAIPNLRELEAVFARVFKSLDPGRLFVFDMRTIRGLATTIGNCDEVVYDNDDDLMVTVRNNFSYETLSSQRHYIIWQRQDDRWQRQDELHVERGYPAQGIMALLERTGFKVAAVLNPDLTPFDLQHDTVGSVVFMAQKP